MKEERIKIGDKIYFLKYSKYPVSFETIIKQTPNFFKTKNYTLKIEREYIRIIGKSKWCNTTAQLANPTLDDLWQEAKIVSWFDNKNFIIEEKVKVYNLLIQSKLSHTSKELLDNK